MPTVAGFYRFHQLSGLEALRSRLLDRGRELGIRGSVLLAPEGLNGTLSGTRPALDEILSVLNDLAGAPRLRALFSEASFVPFKRLKVRLKREIVTMGCEAHGLEDFRGQDIAPADWDEVTAAEDVVVIDTRNRYETVIGSFVGALDPGLSSFGGFQSWWNRHEDEFRGKKIAMFCTGGIRCEKASRWLGARGVSNVLQLKGGILAYLRDIPKSRSSWQGGCFVFDERVSVGHGLTPGAHRLCQPCGFPVQTGTATCPQCGAALPS